MRVVDLFSGLGGWSKPARERGHDVLTVDLDPRFEADLVANVCDLSALDFPWIPDLVLASPPCETFSLLAVGKNWTGPDEYPNANEPKTPKAEAALAAVWATRRLLDRWTKLGTSYFVVENPRAKLRKLPPLAGLERRTVTFCQYGSPFRKPTDLWGGFPPSLRLRPKCANGDPCHVAAPRGSKTGIQGDLAAAGNGDSTSRRDLAALRAEIPYDLAVAVVAAAEGDLDLGELPFSGSLFR